MTMQFPPFPGFRSQAFTFLRELADNNDREWFKEHKSIFEDELKWPMQCLVVDASRRFESEELPLVGDPRKSVFRIYRDTRFSKDKAPYKTHVAAVLSESGSNKDESGVYIHVEPRNCFSASGYWSPDNSLLAKFRSKIAGNPGEFLDLVEYLQDKDIPVQQRGDGLKRMPRGFEDHADSDVADYLKWKSFIAARNYSQKDLSSPDFTDQLVEFGRDVQPLLAYFG